MSQDVFQKLPDFLPLTLVVKIECELSYFMVFILWDLTGTSYALLGKCYKLVGCLGIWLLALVRYVLRLA